MVTLGDAITSFLDFPDDSTAHEEDPESYTAEGSGLDTFGLVPIRQPLGQWSGFRSPLSRGFVQRVSRHGSGPASC